MGDGSVRDGDADTRVVADGRCDAEPGAGRADVVVTGRAARDVAACALLAWAGDRWLLAAAIATATSSALPKKPPRTDRPLSHGHAAGRSRPDTVERRTGVTGGAGGAAACRAAAPVVLPFRSRCLLHQLARCRVDVVRSRRRRHQVARCRVDVLSGREARASRCLSERSRGPWGGGRRSFRSTGRPCGSCRS